MAAPPKRGPPWWRLLITAVLAVVLVLVLLDFYGMQRGRVPDWLEDMAGRATPELPTGVEDTKVREPEAAALRSLERQRELAADLVRRHVGARLRGGALADLDALQRLLETGELGAEDVYELQALGVALGEVLAEQYGLDWVIYTDEHGSSRALQYRDTESFVFPVTMISRRVEAGLEVDVRALYEKAGEALARAVPELEGAGRQGRGRARRDLGRASR